MTSRASEEFRERMHHAFTPYELRIMPASLLERWVDPEVANRLRLDIYRQQKRGIERMTVRSGQDAEMEKYRATKGDYDMCAREFALSDNLAEMYFSFYGENFEGGEIVDNPDDGWTCPICKLKYGMSLKTLPDRCLRCRQLTPLGRMKKDGAFNRRCPCPMHPAYTLPRRCWRRGPSQKKTTAATSRT